ncbi:MAG: polysaccharide biosynthesis C-terminal domain-containing protein [Chitinophagaceae bacterium]|nr:polysaccharide biosynthesis C-terminal domain-containing protein [Chitinophagaceae bacterium]MCW5925299.1 polysaccharide biosynthesis C-terminal domain-containing protein [Chitinophagaceae bacterium]
MSSIRRQSIISSIIIYIGFALGALNVYFFTKEGYFTESQYGLTTMFVEVAISIQAFACLAMPTYIFKFHPYYEHNLPHDKNDMPAIALVVGIIGFLLVLLAGWVFRDLVIRKYSEHSPDFVRYYFWVFPMGFGLAMFTILEAYGWSIHKPVLTSFLKEVMWRLLVTLLIFLFIRGVITDFEVFIKLYGLTYLIIAIILFGWLSIRGRLPLTLQISKVTRRYLRKIISLCIFVYSGLIVNATSLVFDTLVIASLAGLEQTGVFTLARFLTSIIQVPQRAVVASSVSHLSKAWRVKDMQKIQRIYQRSSINMLLFSLCIFFLIMLNYKDAVVTFGLKEIFLSGFSAFIFLGLTRVVDMGCGISTHVIATSNYWRFELVSNIILLTIMLPLTYLLAKKYGIMGPAIANLISFTIFNIIRISFLWWKFRLQPFSRSSAYAVLIAVACYVACYYSFRDIHGFPGLFLRGSVFLVLFGGAAVLFRLSPDIRPVWNSLLKRAGLKKQGH